MTRAGTYQIEVCGRLPEQWSDWFAPMTITVGQRDDGSTVTTLAGLADQALLHGILSRIRDLNLTLLSVSLTEEQADSSMAGEDFPANDQEGQEHTAKPRADDTANES